MTEAIVLSNKALADITQWQDAIDTTLYNFELETPIPIESLDGYIPVKWKKSPSDRSPMKTGFYCQHIPVSEARLDVDFQKPSDNYFHALALGWDDDLLTKITTWIAGAAYASATAGVILLRNSAPLRPDELLANVKEDIRLEFLPRHHTTFQRKGRMKQDGRYRFDERPNTIIRNVGGTELSGLKQDDYAVLVGRNNSGKSFVLKALTEHWGKGVSYLGPVRYQNFNLLTHYTPTENKQEDKWRQFSSQWSNDSQNVDNSPLNLQQAIAELSNSQRATLKQIASSLLGVDLQFCFTLESNEMSQKYVSCNGHNISFTSSGLRLIITIITSLLDETYKTVLIDEPELGISPEAQGILADFICSRKNRQQYFPHIKTLMLATHSTVFLDRQNIRNNYAIDKVDDTVRIRQIRSQQEFNSIHFFLLGNRFETLYLPSAIFIVEGKTDRMFIERVLATRYPGSSFSVIAANGDNQIKHYLHITRGILNDIQRSPYHDRIFVILDSKHSAGLPSEVKWMGVPEENIVVWPENGIEFVYPDKIIDEIFGSGPEIVVTGDLVSRNGVTLSKNDLAERVCARISAETAMSSALMDGLLNRLDCSIK